MSSADEPIEGVDYVVEDGRWVMTAGMLARRGTCCGSGCRSCPYVPAHTGDPNAKIAWPLSAPVISLVPSWTETLFAIGVRPAARTKFCIHPEGAVSDVRRAGGTKDLDLDVVRELAPRLAVLDRQENTREMAAELEALGIECWASDVRDLGSLRDALVGLAARLEAHHVAFDRAAHASLVARLDALVGASLRRWTESPVALRWLTPRPDPGVPVAYVIWNRPAMCVAPGTFIAEQLRLRGASVWVPPGTTSSYPQLDVRALPRPLCLLLSTEPFPFGEPGRAAKALAEWGLADDPEISVAIADGEALSWFGVRAITALEEDRETAAPPGPSSA